MAWKWRSSIELLVMLYLKDCFRFSYVDSIEWQGYNGSQLWDTALAVQAVLATNLVRDYDSMLRKAHVFIKASQVRRSRAWIKEQGYFANWMRSSSSIILNEILEFSVFKMPKDSSGDCSSWYRHRSKGGWPFSTTDNGWIVSDCTAEGLKVDSDSK